MFVQLVTQKLDGDLFMFIKLAPQMKRAANVNSSQNKCLLDFSCTKYFSCRRCYDNIFCCRKGTYSIFRCKIHNEFSRYLSGDW